MSLGVGAYAALGSGFHAKAANVSGYRALVCVFLAGGLDGHDTVLPYDVASYNEYATIRDALLLQYSFMPGGSTRDRSRLLPINPVNAADFGSRQFALPPELPNLHNLFETGAAALVTNVGPLIEPMGRNEFISGGAQTPARLFSHNDQTSTWLTMRPEGAQFGWGGRFADEVLASFANSDPAFTAVTTQGTEAFLSGLQARPYQLGLNGAPVIDALVNQDRSTPEGERVYQALNTHIRMSNFSSANLIERDFAAAVSDAIAINERFNQARGTLPPLGVTFPSSSLGNQLRAVAEAIAVRGSLGVNRQMFYVSTDGFDTHAQQAVSLPGLQSNVDDCIFAFHTAIQNLGLGNDVTLFTASDFGRTLVPNGDGTDHGWGGHHFAVGGAVNGRRIYGQIPPYTLNHNQDAGNGRLIPTTSVEEFAEPLGRWFGLNDVEIARALPNRTAFPNPMMPIL